MRDTIHRSRAPGWALLVLVAAGCAAPRVTAPPTPPPAPAVQIGAEQTGDASWYGSPYHGRRTSSGEVYDMHQLTAAHPTLPLGTSVLVTNLKNERSVEVRVNDRGPFVAGRILDLSYAAARLLDAVGPGVIPVRIRVIALPGDGTPRAGGGYTVQVGSFSDRAKAEALRGEVARNGDSVSVNPRRVGGDTYYRVQVGSFPERGSARVAAERLAARGYPVLVVEKE